MIARNVALLVIEDWQYVPLKKKKRKKGKEENKKKETRKTEQIERLPGPLISR